MATLRAIVLFTVAFFQVTRARWRRGPLLPTWSFGFEATVRYLRLAWDRSAGWDPARVRADVASRPYPRYRAPGITIADGALGGIPIRTFSPRARSSDVVVLFFHGGSFQYGSAKGSHAELLTRLAEASGVEVIGADYRLAPEAPFPAQHEDARAAFDALVGGGVAPGRVVLAGDSAGGNLAIELALALRDDGITPRALALISPWADLTMPGASFRENEAYDFGTREVLVRQADLYAGGVALDDPRISPIRADLAGLPRTLIVAGERELPRDDELALADALKAAGVEVTRHVAPELPHDPPVFAGYHPAAQRALEAVARFVL